MAKGDFLGEFELYVLLALSQLRTPPYGNAIRREIEARTGREIAVGAVYATLARLSDKGLVRFTLSAPEPIPADAPASASASRRPEIAPSATRPKCSSG